jgi:hypothetical protein
MKIVMDVTWRWIEMNAHVPDILYIFYVEIRRKIGRREEKERKCFLIKICAEREKTKNCRSCVYDIVLSDEKFKRKLKLKN